MAEGRRTIRINRAPVLTLWAAVVAERLGLERDEALTIGRAISGVTAHAKGVRLGIFEPTPQAVSEHRKALKHGEELQVHLMGRTVPVVHTPEGLRALNHGKPIAPASVERYVRGKFGDALDDVQEAMATLAASMPPEELAKRAFGLYEDFRPAVKAGASGWGQEGELDLEHIRSRGPAA